MNGFEPLRRRIIDYTEAGQWSEVYDGPLEDSESEKLKAENEKLIVKLNAEHIVRQNVEIENAKLRELVAWMYRLMDESCAVQHTYAPEPIRYDTLLDVYEKLRELGIEVD